MHSVTCGLCEPIHGCARCPTGIVASPACPRPAGTAAARRPPSARQARSDSQHADDDQFGLNGPGVLRLLGDRGRFGLAGRPFGGSRDPTDHRPWLTACFENPMPPNAVEPRRKPAATVEPSHRPPGVDQRLLRQVFGFVVVAAQRRAHRHSGSAYSSTSRPYAAASPAWACRKASVLCCRFVSTVLMIPARRRKGSRRVAPNRCQSRRGGSCPCLLFPITLLFGNRLPTGMKEWGRTVKRLFLVRPDRRHLPGVQAF